MRPFHMRSQLSTTEPMGRIGGIFLISFLIQLIFLTIYGHAQVPPGAERGGTILLPPPRPIHSGTGVGNGGGGSVEEFQQRIRNRFALVVALSDTSANPSSLRLLCNQISSIFEMALLYAGVQERQGNFLGAESILLSTLESADRLYTDATVQAPLTVRLIARTLNTHRRYTPENSTPIVSAEARVHFLRGMMELVRQVAEGRTSVANLAEGVPNQRPGDSSGPNSRHQADSLRALFDGIHLQLEALRSRLFLITDHSISRTITPGGGTALFPLHAAAVFLRGISDDIRQLQGRPEYSTYFESPERRCLAVSIDQFSSELTYFLNGGVSRFDNNRDAVNSLYLYLVQWAMPISERTCQM